MKHRWFLVLACGWVLMQPPPKIPIVTRIKVWMYETLPPNDPQKALEAIKKIFPKGGFPPDLEAPLSKWESGRAFDNAEECEQGKANLIASVPLVSKWGKDMDRFMTELSRATGARCVPAGPQ